MTEAHLSRAFFAVQHVGSRISMLQSISAKRL